MAETLGIYTEKEAKELFENDPILYAELAHQYHSCELPIRGEMRQCITHHHACDCREEKFKQLYVSANFLMAKLGAEGEILSDEEGVSEVMQALDDLDDGVWDVKRVFGEKPKLGVIDENCRDEFEKALNTICIQSVEIKKLTCKLSEIRNGLERLRHDNNWQGVDEVNAFIDGLMAVK